MDVEELKKLEARAKRRLRKGLSVDTVDLLTTLEREKHETMRLYREAVEEAEMNAGRILEKAEAYLWS